MDKDEIIRLIQQAINSSESYIRTRQINIRGKDYTLHIFYEEEKANLYEGILLIEFQDRKEFNYWRGVDPYKEGWAYTPRLIIGVYDNRLLIKEPLNNKKLIRRLDRINKSFIKKLRKALTNPDNENLNRLFDRKDVIEEFYQLYRKSREYMLKSVKGIGDEDKRREFVDNLMMQMLTLWYLQEKGFFNGDKNYFVNKFEELKQTKLKKSFDSFYDFLRYFFEKISKGEGKQYLVDPQLGKIVVIGPAVFLNGETEYKGIQIPDKCFYKKGLTQKLIELPPKKINFDVPLLNLFESRDWIDGNVDEYVLGAIYEKLINYNERKRTGAYYTPEEITSYICENTIKPYLLDRMNEKFERKWKSIDGLIENADKEQLRYLFELVREIKIVDPAVGSGHFLESAIDVLLDIYKKIWKKAKKQNLQGFKIKTSDEKGDLKEIDLLEIKNEEKFKLYVKFFIILSRNIYGVDINGSALKVAKARLFLNLAKHFRGGEEDLFIRFPNVHFNLREGNSLIGYVRLGKKEQGGTLLVFLQDNKRIEKKIKAVKELEEYITTVSEKLGLDGNIIKELDELNEILAKENLSWKDFERVLRIKEKLVKILIASLSSKYAKAINELLNEINKEFNKKLDEKFAEEHEINLEKLKKAKSIPWERKMFHWVFEFPEVFIDNKGFDMVIGNPPYGRLKQIIDDKDEKYFFSKVYSSLYNYQVGNLNLYKLFLERSYNLLKEKGYFSMIFPSSFLGENDSKELRRLFFEECRINKILEFPEKTKVFEGNTQAVCILFYKKSKMDDYATEIKTNITRKEKGDLTSLDFLVVKKSDLKALTGEDYRIPLFYNPQVEWDILKYISKYPPFKGKDKLPPLGEIGEGHLHETFDKEFMSDEPGDSLLIKGVHLDRYFVNLDPNGPKPRWIKDKKRFFEKKPEAKKVTEQEKIIGRNTINKASKPRLRFAPLDKGYVITNNVKFILMLDMNIKPYFLIALLNSTLLNWKFELFSLQNRVNNYEIESLPIPRISKEEQKPFILLAKYMLFLKQYQNYFVKNDKHLQYIIDYFDNLIDCLVYELYLGDVVKVPIRGFVEDKLRDIEFPENLLGTTEDKREKIFKEIESVFKKLENDKKLNENLYLMKLHPWVKTIYESLER